jgi:hypothetical protein
MDDLIRVGADIYLKRPVSMGLGGFSCCSKDSIQLRCTLMVQGISAPCMIMLKCPMQ